MKILKNVEDFHLFNAGLTCPVLFLSSLAESDGLRSDVVDLHSCLGTSWIAGCLLFGFLITRTGSISSTFTENKKQGQMPISRGRNAPVTVTLHILFILYV